MKKYLHISGTSTVIYNVDVKKSIVCKKRNVVIPMKMWIFIMHNYPLQ